LRAVGLFPVGFFPAGPSTVGAGAPGPLELSVAAASRCLPNAFWASWSLFRLSCWMGVIPPVVFRALSETMRDRVQVELPVIT
jgi:hypothetical protein